MPGRIPIGEVEDDAGKKSGFGCAQQKSHDVKHGCAFQKHEGHGDEAPEDHDAGDPDAGADAMEDEVAGDFKDEVADEEEAGAEAENAAEDFIVNAEDSLEMEFGKADVDAVDVGDDVAEKKQGHEPETDAPGDGALLLSGELAGGSGRHGRQVL